MRFFKQRIIDMSFLTDFCVQHVFLLDISTLGMCRQWWEFDRESTTVGFSWMMEGVDLLKKTSAGTGLWLAMETRSCNPGM